MEDHYQALIQNILEQAAHDKRARPWKHTVDTSLSAPTEEWIRIGLPTERGRETTDVRTNSFPMGNADVRMNSFPMGESGVAHNGCSVRESNILTNSFPMGDMNVLTNSFPT